MSDDPNSWKKEILKMLAGDGVLVVVIYFLLENVVNKLNTIIAMLS